MIARQDVVKQNTDVWNRLAAPVPLESISWRRDGQIVARDGRFFARFVCYIEASTVRERLDSVVPGNWDLTIELLPPIKGEEDGELSCAFKARLQILGIIREDVGTGHDYKQASTDAFKRAAVRFGIANELYSYEQNWVEMESDAKYAKPLEDPQHAYDRKYGTVQRLNRANVPSIPMDVLPGPSLTDTEAIHCPQCGGRMWDNRLNKRNPKAPDYKCRNRNCDGVIWPSSENEDNKSDKTSKDGPGSDTMYATEDELPF